MKKVMFCNTGFASDLVRLVWLDDFIPQFRQVLSSLSDQDDDDQDTSVEGQNVRKILLKFTEASFPC